MPDDVAAHAQCSCQSWNSGADWPELESGLVAMLLAMLAGVGQLETCD